MRLYEHVLCVFQPSLIERIKSHIEKPNLSAWALSILFLLFALQIMNLGEKPD